MASLTGLHASARIGPYQGNENTIVAAKFILERHSYPLSVYITGNPRSLHGVNYTI